MEEQVASQTLQNSEKLQTNILENKVIGKSKRRACKKQFIQESWISDTLPVNISIMDDTAKEMLKEKKYNELLQELIGIP